MAIAVSLCYRGDAIIMIMIGISCFMVAGVMMLLEMGGVVLGVLAIALLSLVIIFARH